MSKMTFADAIEQAITQAMIENPDIIILGEDVQLIRINLFTRFGKDRVISTPISESAFLGAGVSAAMAGLRPIVEIMLVDFMGVAMDALINHAAKTEQFSGGKWNVPMVIRAACGGGYGDGGQHEQSLWGWFAHIPGIVVAVPSTPKDAAGLMASALKHDGPVIYLEHKLLADYWLDSMGIGGRKDMDFDVPLEGAVETIDKKITPIPFGKAVIRKPGKDISIISIGVSTHRALEAANELSNQGIDAEVIDLRTTAPLDKKTIINSVTNTRHLLVVDEDYERFGLSGEIAAVALENGLSFKYGRICTQDTIPYSHNHEKQALPNKESIMQGALSLL
ncbi:alpha-ketoacid dehydrogenase subunit beta [Bacteroidota bacterium]